MIEINKILDLASIIIYPGDDGTVTQNIRNTSLIKN